MTRTMITVAVVFGLAGIALFIFWPKTMQRHLETEVYKLTYQFLLVVVVGGALSLIYKEFEREREDTTRDNERRRDDAANEAETQIIKRNAERALQQQFHGEIVQAYHQVKRVRRLLRARTLNGSDSHAEQMVAAGSYDEQMQRLIDVQLSFEWFIHRVRVNQHLFAAVPDLSSDLQRIEEYLNRLVNEYESFYSQLSPQGMVRLASLERLREFIGPVGDATRFKSDLKVPFHNLTAGLEKVITL